MTVVGFVLIAVGAVVFTLAAAWWIAFWSDYVTTSTNHPSGGRSHVRLVPGPYDQDNAR